MTFPKQKDIEIPLLKVLIAAGGHATPKEAIERVTRDFPALTPEDLTMKQPSGKELKWRNMVAWVRNTLCDNGAIDRSVPGTWIITEAGRQMVEEAAQEPPSSLFSLLPRPSPVTPAIVNLGSARIELGFELKPPEHEIHQVRPTLKHHIARQGTNIIEKGLASHQHLAKQRILAIAPLQDRMEEKR